MQQLQKAGHRVFVESIRRAPHPDEGAGRGLDVSFQSEDGRSERLRCLAWLVARHPLRCLADLRARRRWRREERVSALRALAPVARRVSRRRTQHLHAHFAAGGALNALRLGALTGLPFSVATHGYDLFMTPANLREKHERAAFAVTDCDYSADFLGGVVGAETKARIHRLVLGVDGERFKRSTPYPGGRTVIAVTRLVEKKGLVYLIEAAGLLRDRGIALDRLVVIGDGPLRDELDALIQRLGLEDTVELLGSRPPDEVRAELENADLLAMPCVVAANGDRDTMPVVVKEALAMEIPVVATTGGRPPRGGQARMGNAGRAQGCPRPGHRHRGHARPLPGGAGPDGQGGPGLRARGVQHRARDGQARRADQPDSDPALSAVLLAMPAIARIPGVRQIPQAVGPIRRDTVLFDSWRGQYSDNPRAISEELHRRETGLRHAWVLDPALENEVPEWVEPVAPNSAEHLAMMGRARYLVANGTVPGFHLKRRGTFFLQTWHGTPLKRIGFDIPRDAARAPRQAANTLRHNVPRWDLLVSPNAFSTPILREAFAYPGQIAETGYPRNDLLQAPDAEDIRDRVRARLGIGEHQRAVLYAPTFRDAVRFELVPEVQRLARQLGDSHVVLMRAHKLDTADVRVGQGTELKDVSSYPDNRELFLAADVLVTDYSSVMFDFAVTGKPMLFWTYDLAEYRDAGRGFYFDFEQQAPGPLLRTADEVAEAVADLDSSPDGTRMPTSGSGSLLRAGGRARVRACRGPAAFGLAPGLDWPDAHRARGEHGRRRDRGRRPLRPVDGRGPARPRGTRDADQLGVPGRPEPLGLVKGLAVAGSSRRRTTASGAC